MKDLATLCVEALTMDTEDEMTINKHVYDAMGKYFNSTHPFVHLIQYMRAKDGVTCTLEEASDILDDTASNDINSILLFNMPHILYRIRGRVKVNKHRDSILFVLNKGLMHSVRFLYEELGFNEVDRLLTKDLNISDAELWIYYTYRNKKLRAAPLYNKTKRNLDMLKSIIKLGNVSSMAALKAMNNIL